MYICYPAIKQTQFNSILPPSLSPSNSTKMFFNQFCLIYFDCLCFAVANKILIFNTQFILEQPNGIGSHTLHIPYSSFHFRYHPSMALSKSIIPFLLLVSTTFNTIPIPHLLQHCLHTLNHGGWLTNKKFPLSSFL